MSRTDSATIRDAVFDEYRQRTPNSGEFYRRSENALVAGVTGNLRFFKPYPLYFSSGQGAYASDIDGHQYLDCFLCNGPLQLGHRHPQVINQINQHQTIGSLVVNPTLATEVAEQLISIIPCAERVRFVNSGTEAVMTAIRCCRAVTGRSKIIKFFGHYHGQSDQFLVGIGNSSQPIGDGIPNSSVADTVILPYGDIEELRSALQIDNDIAAVLLDPAMHSGGLWGSQKDYLDGVRELTRKHGTLLIFDEVITGFRLALGGAQAYYDVVPDIATFAKALCAGEKLGAVVGRQDVMAVLDPRRGRGQPGIFQSGTTNDGTNALAAAMGSLQVYEKIAEDDGFNQLTRRTKKLVESLLECFSSHGVPCHINQLGPMLQLFFTDPAQPSFAAYSRVDMRPVSLFTLALLAEGILFALPGSTHVYFSFCHTDQDFERIIQGTDNVLRRHDFASLVAAASES